MTGSKYSPGSAPSKSLDAATTGTGRSIPVNDCRQIAWFLQGTGTISGGTVVIETASVDPVNGPWETRDTLTASDYTGGAVSDQGTFPGPIGWARWRITSNITGGGTVTGHINGLLG